MSRARAAPGAAGRERQEQAQASASVQMRQQVEVTIALQGGQGLAATEEIWRERIPPNLLWHWSSRPWAHRSATWKRTSTN
jgi:hypothetical protein